MLIRTTDPFPVLKTERLTLRSIRIEDELEIFGLRSDAGVNQYLDRKPAVTLEDARVFIHSILANNSKGESLYWAITLHGDEKLIGIICLFAYSSVQQSCEIGYELAPLYQGQGIMGEALEKIIDYAFHSLSLQKIIAFVRPGNQRSRSLLERYSFRLLMKQEETLPVTVCYYLEKGEPKES